MVAVTVHDLEAALARSRVLPLIDSERPDRMTELARLLVAAGTTTVEVVLRRQDSLGSLRALSHETGLTVGAGTVMTPAAADAAVDAGAAFLISPGFSAEVGAVALRRGVPYVPGVATATEMMNAGRAGLSLLKFFPAEASGGAPAVAALAAVDPTVRWIPTGGVGPRTRDEYLALREVAAVGGSWLTPRALVDSGRFGELAEVLQGAAIV